MPEIAFAAPILPGKTEDFKRFATEALVARRQEHDDYVRRFHLTKELGWIQQTPQGHMLIVYFESSDPIRSNREFAESKHPYDLWFKQQLQTITGVDFNQPVPVPPQLAFDWRGR